MKAKNINMWHFVIAQIIFLVQDYINVISLKYKWLTFIL